MKDITDYAKQRYTTKAYDSSKKIPAELVTKIKLLLQHSPSSVNAQPWHFILISSDEIKVQLTQATDEFYPANSALLRDASLVVVFCRISIDEDYLTRLLAQEESDGRFAKDVSFKERMHAGRNKFLALNQDNLTCWMEKQIYLNLGQFLLGVATLGIDATAMEGVDFATLDKVLDLSNKGVSSVVAVALGYRDSVRDFNATLPKSRLDNKELFSEL